MKITVIGAGVVGLCTAFELAERGAEVTVVDAGAAGRGASAGNAGWITPFLSTPRAAPGVVGDAARNLLRPGGPARIHPHPTASFLSWTAGFLRASRPGPNQHATKALQRLAATAVGAVDALAERGVAFEHHRDGLAVVALTDATLTAYQLLHSRMTDYGYTGTACLVRGRDVREFDPAIREGVAGVLHLVDERHVRPESLGAGLVAALQVRGVVVKERSAVSRIRASVTGGTAREWVVTLADGAEIVSGAVVVAAAYSSRSLLRSLGVDLPMEVARGTSLTAVGEGTAPRHPLKLAEHMVACSPFDSAVRLSGTFDLGARSTRLSRRRLDAVISGGLRYLHDWRPTTVESQWVGHRPTSPDDLPVIGAVPGHPGLFVNTGHGTLGITLGPTSGALLADEIISSRCQDLLAPFRITRFHQAKQPKLVK
ncbi:NAD(P)/FAD-dependent oxidoreductase [Nocardia sp. NPDC059246]|uniref:NAD(P)/FAD-dependent oxidoreductase n=1 Tax=unclassified Nocardia TaxID=2637762 RepID=UPI0036CADCC7